MFIIRSAILSLKLERKIKVDICIVNPGFNMGGVERVAIELANALQQDKHKVTLVDFFGENNFFYDINKDISVPNTIRKRSLKSKINKKISFAIYNINKRPLNSYNLYREQIDDLINHLKKSDYDTLILCQGMLTALIPVIKRELPEMKIIAWQHNDYDVYTSQYFKEILTDYQEGLKQADMVICLTVADLKKFRLINPNTYNIYNPLTINKTKISELNNKKIVFVGRLRMQQKGLDYLIDIAKMIDEEWVIRVAGDGEDKKQFQKLIKKNNLENKIILEGSLKSEELLELYSSGAIFISTSRWEGFGLVITEAMACGLPIISFSNLGPKEILEDGKYGILIDDHNVDKFISNLNELIKNKSKREVLQQKSLERASDFKMEVILKEWNSKLNSL